MLHPHAQNPDPHPIDDLLRAAPPADRAPEGFAHRVLLQCRRTPQRARPRWRTPLALAAALAAAAFLYLPFRAHQPPPPPPASAPGALDAVGSLALASLQREYESLIADARDTILAIHHRLPIPRPR